MDPNRPCSIEESKVFSLIEVFDSQVRDTGTFEMSVEELCRHLDIPLVDAFRDLYTIAPGLSGYVPHRFTPDSVSELAGLIDGFSDFDAYRVFHSCGVLLDREDQSELAALYFDTVNGVLAAHTPQTEEFHDMCRHFRTPRRAFEVYLDHFFDPADPKAKTIETFLRSGDFTLSHIARYTVKRRLDLFFERNVLSFESLCEPLYERLTGRETRTPPPDANSEALHTLGLYSLPRDRQSLRLHYKALMKTYHPDINPQGLEMSKRINTAYAELLALLS